VRQKKSSRLIDKDSIFKFFALISTIIIPLLLVIIIIELYNGARISIDKFGWSFLLSDEWDPVSDRFGALSALFGTVISTIIAIIIALPISIIIATFLTEFAPPLISSVVSSGIELLAAIPSIIYGIWGLYLFAPFMSDYIQPFLQKIAVASFLFEGAPMGIGMLTAGIILAIMILPYMTALIREIFNMIPPIINEASYGLGATAYETIRNVKLQYTLPGIVGGLFLGVGRAMGETMAVTFVIGNEHSISYSLFSPASTISSTIANEFAEATSQCHISSLIELGLILLIFSIIFQIAVGFITNSLSRRIRVS